MLPEPDNPPVSAPATSHARPDRPDRPDSPATAGSPPSPTHLVLPHASAMSPAAEAALKVLRLPTLETLLARLALTDRDEADEYSRTPPHERTLARLLGWQGEDGRWPFAAHWAAADGLPVDAADTSPADAWALVTPVHWHVGSDQIALLDPAALNLGEAESRALFDAVRPSFEAEGWMAHWGTPLRWYVRHASLAGLETASLDRAIGRNLDLWISNDLAARPMRRLQVEAQMLWHGHPVNEAREERRELPVNSFWLSGCGAPQAGALPAGTGIDERLRAPMLAGDWQAWVDAWAALDAGPIAELLAAADRGDTVQLTLCGERHAHTWQTQPRGLLSRWFGPKRHDALPVLADL